MIGQNRQAAFQQAKADHDYGDINTLLVELVVRAQIADMWSQTGHRLEIALARHCG